MTEIRTLFWDIGGVLLTNGWDAQSRRQAAERFDLNWEDFQERHMLVSTEFEKGTVSMDEYLESTVFHKPRDFSKPVFQEFMFSRSQPKAEVLSLVRKLAVSGQYLMATLNNESRELNLYRIEKFDLIDYFTAFFSSCFLGVKKPEKGIYQAALEVTQRNPAECLYIDDRALNLECAVRLGIATIHFQNPTQLLRELRSKGIETSEE